MGCLCAQLPFPAECLYADPDRKVCLLSIWISYAYFLFSFVLHLFGEIPLFYSLTYALVIVDVIAGL